MADKKISALTAATTPLAGTEVLPIVQGGTTKKVSVDDLTTGKVVTTGPIISVGAGKDRLVIEPQNAGSGALLLSTNAAGNAYTPVLVDGSTAVIKVAGTEVARTNSNGIAPVAGKGIDFSANGGDILTQYDEGTFTPTWSGGTVTVNQSNFTRIGRQVTWIFDLTFGASADPTQANISLPFNSSTWGVGSINFTDYGSTVAVNIDPNSDTLAFRGAMNAGNLASDVVATKRFIGAVTYFI